MKLVKKILLAAILLFSLSHITSQYANASALPYTFIEGVSKKLGDVPQTAQTFASDYQQALYTVGAILASQLIFNKLRKYYIKDTVNTRTLISNLKNIIENHRSKKSKAISSHETDQINQARNQFSTYNYYIPLLFDVYVNSIENGEYDLAQQAFEAIDYIVDAYRTQGWLGSKILKTTDNLITGPVKRAIEARKKSLGGTSSWWPSFGIFNF